MFDFLRKKEKTEEPKDKPKQMAIIVDTEEPKDVFDEKLDDKIEEITEEI